MSDSVDMVTRLRCTFVADGCGQCTFCLARNEIKRLRSINKSLRLDLIACRGELMGSEEEINDLRLKVVALSIPKEAQGG